MSSYHQHGTVAEQRRDLDAAEAWYRKSLEIEERQGNEHGAATSQGVLERLDALRQGADGAQS